jgi:hypothetical protein
MVLKVRSSCAVQILLSIQSNFSLLCYQNLDKPGGLQSRGLSSPTLCNTRETPDKAQISARSPKPGQARRPPTRPSTPCPFPAHNMYNSKHSECNTNHNPSDLRHTPNLLHPHQQLFESTNPSLKRKIPVHPQLPRPLLYVVRRTPLRCRRSAHWQFHWRRRAL